MASAAAMVVPFLDSSLRSLEADAGYVRVVTVDHLAVGGGGPRREALPPPATATWNNFRSTFRTSTNLRTLISHSGPGQSSPTPTTNQALKSSQTRDTTISTPPQKSWKTGTLYETLLLLFLILRSALLALDSRPLQLLQGYLAYKKPPPRRTLQ